MASYSSTYPIFGASRPWDAADWTASDDRVRGGSSQSFIECSTDRARFYGTLDIETLGGAGFASQRTTGEDRKWDLTRYDGILLKIADSDNRTYTLILKDTLLAPGPDTGREQATISYEYDFKASDLSKSTDGSMSLFIPWNSFKATYRGREKKDSSSIQLMHIRRLSVMNRSFFGGQEGDFTLTIRSIEATWSSSLPTSSSATESLGKDDGDSLQKPLKNPPRSILRGIMSWVTGCLRWAK